LIYPAIASIPQLTWEMEREEAEFILTSSRRDRARSKSELHQIKLLHPEYSLSRGCEVSDYRNDLLADQFDGRNFAIIGYADNQVLDTGVIDALAVFYSLAHAV